MTNRLVEYRGKNTAQVPSPNLWADCPLLQYLAEGTGYGYQDDFMNFSDHISDQDTQQYSSYIDTGVTLTQAAGEVGGAVEVAGNDADNDEGSIQTGGNSGGGFLISDTAGSDKKLWFEACLKKASVADNALAVFVGLAEEGLAAANTLVDDTGEVASKDLIGFQTLHANGDLLVFCWRKAGQAKQSITLDTSQSALTADTYFKVGFKYDPTEDAANRIKIYVDNVLQSTKVTGTNIAAATFPDGEELAMLLATKVGAAAESKMQMDWWKCWQER